MPRLWNFAALSHASKAPTATLYTRIYFLHPLLHPCRPKTNIHDSIIYCIRNTYILYKTTEFDFVFKVHTRGSILCLLFRALMLHTYAICVYVYNLQAQRPLAWNSREHPAEKLAKPKKRNYTHLYRMFHTLKIICIGICLCWQYVWQLRLGTNNNICYAFSAV